MQGQTAGETFDIQQCAHSGQGDKIPRVTLRMPIYSGKEKHGWRMSPMPELALVRTRTP